MERFDASREGDRSGSWAHKFPIAAFFSNRNDDARDARDAAVLAVACSEPPEVRLGTEMLSFCSVLHVLEKIRRFFVEFPRPQLLVVQLEFALL